MKILNSVTEFDSLIESGNKVVVDFFADWCGPCKMLGPVMEEVAKGKPDITFVKVNVDELGEVAMRYGIMSIPTVISFKDGKEVAKFVGYQPKPGVEKFVSTL